MTDSHYFDDYYGQELDQLIGELQKRGRYAEINAADYPKLFSQVLKP